MSALSPLLPYAWYPLTVGGAIVIFVSLLSAGAPVTVSLYAAVAGLALVVISLQRRFPARSAWRPRGADARVDATYMALVQVALPWALAAACVLALGDRVRAEAPGSPWPHHWPLPAQVLLMLAAVDLARYWLHRACHRVPWLWRLHAVHHSPRILYSLNAGRFHPLEKTLHVGVDTVPFLALGVAPEVMAGYFLLYACNGLFQHSNIHLRHGWLNYLVASAEIHRWHHARHPHLAACNYGSTTAIWDLLFGTWRLPGKRQLEEVGIMDSNYPTEFRQQLLAPFRGAGDRLLPIVRRWLADGLIKTRLRLTLAIQGLRIAGAVRDPMRVQRALLAGILRENSDTSFGREHGFAGIDGYEAFVRRVPVADFEALRSYVEAQIETGARALTQSGPARYVRTSGSTGKPKDIPLTDLHLEALRRIHETAIAYQYRKHPEAFGGSILAIVSPACEGVLRGGKPYGSASGIVAGNTPAVVREKFVVPPEVFAIDDSRLKYLLILRLALQHRDLTYVGTANATTLLALMRLYREHRSELIDGLRHGTFFLLDRVHAAAVPAVCSRLRACPERADEIAALHTRRDSVRMADLWPDLRVVVTWTCASAGSAVGALRRELPSATRVLELGYIASEFRATITLGRRAGLPTLDTHFFEFVERDRWDRGEPEFLTLDRIRKGVDYYIVVTTPSGLYRYFINDLVRVTGSLHRTPLLRFVQKGKGVTNITGEKVYECQVLDAVRSAMSALGRAPRFLIMLADEERCRYRLYVESDSGPRPAAVVFGRSVDAELARLNIEYRAKRESERLGPIDAHWLREEAGDAYKQFCVGNGQREGQFKPVALAYRKGVGFDFDRFVTAA